MKFKAKPKDSVFNHELYSYEWTPPIDADGYIYGWYVDGFIVGAVQESTDEYIALDFWCPVEEDTLEVVKEDE